MPPDRSAADSPEDAKHGRRYVFATIPRCPTCGGARLATDRSVRSTDGAKQQWKTCRSCGAKFFVIWE